MDYRIQVGCAFRCALNVRLNVRFECCTEDYLFADHIKFSRTRMDTQILACRVSVALWLSIAISLNCRNIEDIYVHYCSLYIIEF